MNPILLRSFRAIAPLFFPPKSQKAPSFPPTLGIDREQAEFFKRNGYLVKHNVVPPELLARAIDYVWSLFPDRFERNDPSTWQGLVKDSLCERDVQARKGHVKYRQNVRDEPWLYDMIDKNPCIRSTVEGMIGAARTPRLPYIRGLYPVLPCKLGWATYKRTRPHTDGHQFLLGTLTYLSDVTPGGGGFHVWPGSHLALRQCFEKYAGQGKTARIHRELYSFALRTPALEIVAPAGTTIFWHHRLAHAAGINRTREIRHALLADFPSTDFDDLAKKPVGPDEWAHWNFTLTSPS